MVSLGSKTLPQRQILKQVMNAMGCGRDEKEHEEGDRSRRAVCVEVGVKLSHRIQKMCGKINHQLIFCDYSGVLERFERSFSGDRSEHDVTNNSLTVHEESRRRAEDAI